MADGFSLTATSRGVSAVYVDRVADWPAYTEGDCDDPPEESLFDAR